ncbi:MAG: hypothetical protein J0L51_00870 [Rhizobiales bacterium]|nr:hypothetical protein [Hyphomicrobiales bacterium]
MRAQFGTGWIGLALLISVPSAPLRAQQNELPAITAPAPSAGQRQNTGAIQPRMTVPAANTNGDARFPLPPRAGGISASPGSGGIPPNTPVVEPPRQAEPRPIGPREPVPPRAPVVSSPIVRAPVVASPKVTPPLMRAPVEPSRMFPVEARQPPAGTRPKFEARQPSFGPAPPGYRPPLPTNRIGPASPPPGRTALPERRPQGASPTLGSGAQTAPPGFMPVPRPNRPVSPGPVARPGSPLAPPAVRRGVNPPSAMGRCTPQMVQQKMC